MSFNPKAPIDHPFTKEEKLYIQNKVLENVNELPLRKRLKTLSYMAGLTSEESQMQYIKSTTFPTAKFLKIVLLALLNLILLGIVIHGLVPLFL